MAAPRKHPPKDAAATIQRLAAEGYSNIGLARYFKVSRPTLNRWLEESEALDEAFEFGRDMRRHELEQSIYLAAVSGKGQANISAMFLLKSRFGFREGDQQNVAVAVNLAPVMLVQDFGTDAEWERKALEQQAKLVADSAHPQHKSTPALQAPSQPILEATAVVYLDEDTARATASPAPVWSGDIPAWMPR